MNTIAFRSVTPLYNFSIHEKEFSFSGKIKDADYTISLKRYEHVSNLVRLSNEIKILFPDIESDKLTNEILQDIPFSKFNGYILVTETRHHHSEELAVSSNSQESLYVSEYILNALDIHTTNGLLYKNRYLFRAPKLGGHGKSISLVNRNPVRFFNEDSVLPVSEFSNCQRTFDYLLNKQIGQTWKENAVFDKIIRLALEYHKITFTVTRIEHAFLILMITFEALFKKETEDNITQATDRIARLLSNTKSDLKIIKGDFLQPENSFEKIRNEIAHGNPSLDTHLVETKYPALYAYITRAIAILLSIDNTGSVLTEKYYDEITEYVKNRFDTLPTQ